LFKVTSRFVTGGGEVRPKVAGPVAVVYLPISAPLIDAKANK
jgi:hypothetical protein